MGITVTKESCAIKTVCRRLGYAGVETGHEKAVRSFLNSRDVYTCELCQLAVENLNANTIAPGPLCLLTEVSRIVFPLWLEPPRKTTLQQIVFWQHYCVAQYFHTVHDIIYYIFKMICHNVCNYMEQKWNRQFTSPSMVKNGLGTGLITI